MNPEELIKILQTAAALKTNTRHCCTAPGRKESIADHSWRIALMAMLLSGEQEFQNTDMNKVIRMCLIHDLGEAFTGDIPSFEKSDEAEKTEAQIFTDWVKGFPSPQAQEWLALLAEMNALESKEAKTYKALDKMEAVLSHNESDISTWLPLEYQLQLAYGQDEVSFSDYFTQLKEQLDNWTRRKISESGNAATALPLPPDEKNTESVPSQEAP